LAVFFVAGGIRRRPAGRQAAMADVDTLEVRGVEADAFLRVEQHALDPIPATDRHGAASGLFLLWGASQANYSSILTGSLLLGLIGLGVVESMVAIVVGAVLAGLVLGLLSVVGPRTGQTQVVASRATFGRQGAGLGAFLTLFLAIGWFAVDSVIATNAALELAGHANAAGVVKGLVLLGVVVLSMLVAIYGHQTLSVFERFGAILFVAFAVLMFAVLLPKMHLHLGATVSGGAHVGAWILGASITFALIASWYGFASDYSRYLPARVNARAVTLFAGGGIALTTALLGILGVLLLSISSDRNADVLKVVKDSLPGVLSVPFLLYVVIGMVWGNYFDVYTAGLSTLAMGVKLPRWGAAALCGVVGGALAYWALFTSSFFTDYENFLLLTYVWAPAWAAVVLVDFFLLRNGRSAAAGMRHALAIRWPALIAWALGTGAAMLFVSSSLWTSPLSTHLLKGGDLSGVAGFAVGGIAYYALMRAGSRTPRGEAATA
jgi:NCS1 family nucleobase:cation symporter-1